MNERPNYDDQNKCPLCGSNNDCAVAAGRDPDSCWCMTATMNPSALTSIPQEAQGKVCICAQCASASPEKG